MNKPAFPILVFSLFLFAAEHAAVGAGNEFSPSRYEKIEWEQLVPSSWHPGNVFDGLDIDELSDDDPRAVKAMEDFLAEWNKAPANPDMEGKLIKLPGFVVPLDWENDAELKEFLLVPYFGACIHVPPPPANQVIHIKLDKPLAGVESMAAIWVYGVLSLERHEAELGTAGYALAVDRIEAYTETSP